MHTIYQRSLGLSQRLRTDPLLGSGQGVGPPPGLWRRRAAPILTPGSVAAPATEPASRSSPEFKPCLLQAGVERGSGARLGRAPGGNPAPNSAAVAEQRAVSLIQAASVIRPPSSIRNGLPRARPDLGPTSTGPSCLQRFPPWRSGWPCWSMPWRSSRSWLRPAPKGACFTSAGGELGAAIAGFQTLIRLEPQAPTPTWPWRSWPRGLWAGLAQR
jgi:hypothetical protein